MRRLTIAVALGLLLVSSGCKRYSLTLDVQPPEGVSLEDLQLSATLYAPGASSGVDCERIAFGDFGEDDLLASLVGHALLEGEVGELGEIPRQGQKIVVVRAVDDQDRLQLAGCSAHGDVQGQLVVQVDLEPSAQIGRLRFINPTGSLALNDALAAEVPDQGVAETEPPVRIEQRDAGGEVLSAGSRLRVRVIDPAGEVQPAFELLSDADGMAELVAEIRFTGAFTVELAPRWSPFGDGHQLLSGFAAPAERHQQPFGNDEIYWSVPLRLGQQDAGYAAMTRRGLAAPSLRMARAVIDGNGGLSFSVSEGDPGFFYPVGRAYDNRLAVDEAALVLQEVADLQGGGVNPEVLLVHADARLDRAVRLAWSDHEPQASNVVLSALAAGPCDARAVAGADVDAPPLMLSFLPRASSAGGVTAPMRMVALDGRSSQDLAGCWPDDTVTALASFCVADENQAHHRLAWLRIVNTDDEASNQIIDLGDGLPAAMLDRPLTAFCEYLDGRPRQEFNFAGAMGSGLGGDDEPRLLSSGFAGLNLRLEVQRASSRPQEVLVTETVLVDGLRAPAEMVGGGAFSGIGRHDVVSLLSLRSVEETEWPAILTFLHSPGSWEGGGQFGGLALGRCGQVQRLSLGLTRAACWVHVADLDGDGRDELLTSRVPGRTGEDGETIRADHQVFRFGNWWASDD